MANKLRSFLAILGIIIGVASVIAMLGIAAGAHTQIMDRIQSMGSDLLVVRPGQRIVGGVATDSRRNLKLEDAIAMLEVPGLKRVAPVVQGSGQAKYLNRNAVITVIGSNAAYFGMRNFEIDKGRLFSLSEENNLAKVAVIGPAVAESLFGASNPLDEVIKVNGLNFEVVGIFASKGDQGWFNPDNQIIIPYLTAMKQLFGQDFIREIDLQGMPGGDLDKLQAEATTILRQRHKLLPTEENDFEIRNQADIVRTASDINRVFSLLLGSVAGISLFVGGIGIMNIMLVTVTERTREIGVRKAIGARDRDILRQFLFESMMMSGLGGVIGVGIGISAAKIIGILTNFTPEVQLSSIIMSISFAAGIGIFFGYYPAHRAARLNPIEALRYE